MVWTIPAPEIVSVNLTPEGRLEIVYRRKNDDRLVLSWRGDEPRHGLDPYCLFCHKEPMCRLVAQALRVNRKEIRPARKVSGGQRKELGPVDGDEESFRKWWASRHYIDWTGRGPRR